MGYTVRTTTKRDLPAKSAGKKRPMFIILMDFWMADPPGSHFSVPRGSPLFYPDSGLDRPEQVCTNNGDGDGEPAEHREAHERVNL